jgi:hypothetical protein
MFPCAHHRHPSWWPLTLAATLALAPGCSKDPEPEYELVSFRNSRGLISYRYVPKKPPAAKAPTAAPSPSLDVWLRQQWALAQAENQRRQDALAEQDMKRQRDEERRREQQEVQAYNDWWSQNRRDQRLQEQGRYRAYLQQSSQWFENQRQRGAAEVARWQQISQAIDASLQSQQ